jgi:hypothetical protein
MCIIIDSNCASKVFTSPPLTDFLPLHRWINDRNGSMVLGGKNKQELFRIEKARLAIIEWNRRSKAFFINDDEIAAKDRELCAQPVRPTSNDSHMLALAIVSGARWLCSTGDTALCNDFKNPKLLPKRRGRIYKYASHGSRLDHTRFCHYSRLNK